MKQHNISGILAGALWLLTARGWWTAYGSRWLEVRVVDKQSGSPIGQAAVCLGTSARPDQFGARRAAADGVVRFDDLPVNSMMLTASKRGYRGKQQRVEPLSGNRVIVLSLARGGGGPVCAAAAADEPPQVTGELEITDVRITADSASSSGNRVVVKTGVSGEADQVRIAESADFAGSEWMDLKAENYYTLSPGKGVKQLYIQVRRRVKTKGASIEALSPVKVVPYRYY
jgi:hypothetical protein